MLCLLSLLLVLLQATVIRHIVYYAFITLCSQAFTLDGARRHLAKLCDVALLNCEFNWSYFIILETGTVDWRWRMNGMLVCGGTEYASG
ncbi:uncharacterized protein BJ212DRAFT_539048 [Suillus subaureus]|uniref:Secreted protein n=1 Tax=Suillus subaureus TaxID=48587 RepID=A0A9P7EKQ1_9AGAM|nr:uncharacterized protein BJ212DRAFT_539048 [Suillus subaureus]KAG1824610.1 hypothetical protein BJ212DRAFT_539048 [Suillus subaureus]